MCILLFSDITKAQIKIGHVIVEDNIAVTSDEVETNITDNNRYFDTLRISSAIDSIRKYCLKKGFLLDRCVIKYSLANKEYYNLNIVISGLKSISISSFEISGDSNMITSALQSMMLNSQFSENKIKNSIDQLLNYYEENGLPFASVQIEKINIDTLKPSANILLNIRKGDSIRIESFKITGNDITDENIIIRHSGISKGEYFKRSVIDQIPGKLLKLEVFESVAKPEILLNNYGGVLGINLKESRTLSFDGILGYLPSENSDESGEITGLFNVSFNNLFGTARKLSVIWQKENRSSQTINLKYVEPDLLSLPVKMELNFFQREQDSLYVQRNLKINNSLLLSKNILGSVYLQYESVIPGRENSSSYLTSSKLYSIGFELAYDTRNNLRLATNGVNNRNFVEVGNKKYTSNVVTNASKSVKKIGVDIDSYNSLFKGQILYNSFHGRMLICPDMEQTDLFYLGGVNSMRGYRENQFMASSTLWINNEYRFAFQDNTFIYPFFDIGYYKRHKTIDDLPEDEEFLYSYGLGFNITSDVGIIKLNFSLGKEDKLSGMKVHLGFKNNF